MYKCFSIDKKTIDKTSTDFSRVYRNFFYSVSSFESYVSFFSFQDIEFLNYESPITKPIEQCNFVLLFKEQYIFHSHVR